MLEIDVFWLLFFRRQNEVEKWSLTAPHNFSATNYKHEFSIRIREAA